MQPVGVWARVVLPCANPNKGLEMWGFEHYGMGWGMILVWLVPILLVALVILYGIRGRNGNPGQTALDILDARYARGEIDRDEFLKRRNDLTG